MNDIIFTSAESKSVFMAQSIKWKLSFSHAANRFAILQGDGDYYQDQGNDSMAGELYFIFAPESADEEAFFSAIKERGAGVITQPDRTDTLNIQPLAVEKSIDLVNDVQRVRFTVTFVTSRLPGEVSSTQALYSALNKQNSDAVTSAGTVLETSQDVNSLVDAQRQVANFTDALNSATRHLNVVASDLEASIDSIVSDPVQALIAFKQFIEQPGIIYERIANKLSGYQDLVADLLNITPYPGQGDTQKANDLFFAEAMTSTVIAAKTQASVEAGYTTKQEVLRTANQLVTEYGTSRDTLDQYQAAGAFQQTGTTQEQTSRLINSTASFLFSISFNLKTEFIYITDGPTTIYDIMATYYQDKLEEEGEIATLDYIIGTNTFSGDELLIVPTHREVLVYV